MKSFVQSFTRSAFGLLLATGVATAAIAGAAEPAQAGVVISVGIGGGGYGYAPAYRPYPRHFYYRHRRYVPAVWAVPVVYPAYAYPAYGFPAYGYPAYRRPYRDGYARYGHRYDREYYGGHRRYRGYGGGRY